MKKFIVTSLVVALFVPVLASAQVATTTKSQVTSTSGGYYNACFYIKAYDKVNPCVDSKELQTKFIFDREFHNQVIGKWFATWRVTWD